ncbi:hypothetical protein RJ641_012355, partial [Dillenia turbinata]
GGEKKNQTLLSSSSSANRRRVSRIFCKFCSASRTMLSELAKDNAAWTTLILAASFRFFHSSIVVFKAILVLKPLDGNFFPVTGQNISSEYVNISNHSAIAFFSNVIPLSIVTGSSMILLVNGQKKVSYKGLMC